MAAVGKPKVEVHALRARPGGGHVGARAALDSAQPRRCAARQAGAGRGAGRRAAATDEAHQEAFGEEVHEEHAEGDRGVFDRS